MFNGYHKSVYENYMNEMEGEYSIEKKEYINSEYQKFQAIMDLSLIHIFKNCDVNNH